MHLIQNYVVNIQSNFLELTSYTRHDTVLFWQWLTIDWWRRDIIFVFPWDRMTTSTTPCRDHFARIKSWTPKKFSRYISIRYLISCIGCSAWTWGWKKLFTPLWNIYEFRIEDWSTSTCCSSITNFWFITGFTI